MEAAMSFALTAEQQSKLHALLPRLDAPHVAAKQWAVREV